MNCQNQLSFIFLSCARLFRIITNRDRRNGSPGRVEGLVWSPETLESSTVHQWFSGLQRIRHSLVYRTGWIYASRKSAICFAVFCWCFFSQIVRIQAVKRGRFHARFCILRSECAQQRWSKHCHAGLFIFCIPGDFFTVAVICRCSWLIVT